MRLFFISIISLTIAIYTHGRCGAVCRDRCSTCPQCNTCCDLTVEPDKEEKSCWKVECEEICIPKVVFPWQKSCCDPCANNGAHVRTVKVLKKHTYECPACKYTWTPKKVGCCTDQRGCVDDCTDGVIGKSIDISSVKTQRDTTARSRTVTRQVVSEPSLAPVPATTSVRPASFTTRTGNYRDITSVVIEKPASAARRPLPQVARLFE